MPDSADAPKVSPWLKIAAPVFALSLGGLYVWSEHIRQEPRKVSMISSKLRQIASPSQQYILEMEDRAPAPALYRTRTVAEHDLHDYLAQLRGVTIYPKYFDTHRALQSSLQLLNSSKFTETSLSTFLPSSKVGIEFVDPKMVEDMEKRWRNPVIDGKARQPAEALEDAEIIITITSPEDGQTVRLFRDDDDEADAKTNTEATPTSAQQ